MKKPDLQGLENNIGRAALEEGETNGGEVRQTWRG